MFEPSKVLPPHLAIPSLDNHLYRIGICPTSYGHNTERRFYNNPAFIAIIQMTHLIKCVVNLILSDPIIFIINGDFARMLGIRVYYNIVRILFAILNLNSMIIWHYNKLNKVYPTFLNLFQMLSGSVKPISVGLTDIKEIRILIRKTQLLVRVAHINSMYVIDSFAFIITFANYILNDDLMAALTLGLLNSIHFLLFVAFGMRNLFNLGFYFHLLAYYFKIKIKNYNLSIFTISKRINKCIYSSVWKSIDSIHKEISNCNQIFLVQIFFIVLDNFGNSLRTSSL